MVRNFYCVTAGNVAIFGPTTGNTVWSNVRDGATGASVISDDGTGETMQCRLTGSNYLISRHFLPFDLTRLPKGSKLNSCTVNFYTGAKTGNTFGTAHVVAANMTDTSSPVVGDYSKVTFSSLGSATLVANDWNTITINVSNLTHQSINQFALIMDDDLTNTPALGEEVITSIVTSGYTNKPYLAIDYVPFRRTMMI